MLTEAQRARLTIVLVGARNPSNIGAAARAMQDFGFSDLRVVNAFTPPFEAAQLEVSPPEAKQVEVQPESYSSDRLDPVKSAVGAGNVMRSARRFDDLPSAIADCHLIVGTTAIGERGLSLPVTPLREAAAPILTALSEEQVPEASARVALLFGSEKTGLTRQQLSFCSLLLTIPLFQPEGERHLSMNLGQSVAVVLYELARSGFEGARELPLLSTQPSTVADRERLHLLLHSVMQKTGYTERFPANAREAVTRQLVNRVASTHREATTWMGIFRQVLKHLPAVSEEI